MEYLNSLNNIQKDCVQNTEGPMIIISGPGSGKTRVITCKIAHILNMGVNPYNILALTFTNKSAKEMVKRIQSIATEKSLWNLWAGTFHSMFAKILRIEAEVIGFNSHFTILDNDDSKSMIKRIIQDYKLDKEIYKPNAIFSKISLLKNNLIDPKKYKEDHQMQKDDRDRNQPKFLLIYKTYTERCKQNGNMDFDDLLVNTLKLFKIDVEILKKYQNIFKYILIDEFQDTNILQLEIIKILSQKNKNLCVVGDDSQSIYSFRGANINNILSFSNLYPNARIFKLEQNYRSTKIILNAANSLILNNQKKLEKNIWTKKEDGEKIKLTKTDSDKSEGLLIAKQIQKASPKGNYSDHLILYRMNSQSRSVEDGLRRLNISYKVFGLSFYKRKEINDVLAYLKVIVNTRDEESLLRIINFPTRGIGKTSIERVRDFSIKNNITIWEVFNKIHEIEININKGIKDKIHDFSDTLKTFLSQKDENAFKLTNSLIETFNLIGSFSKENTIENMSKIENIRELLNAIKSFSDENENNTIANFLDQSVLVNENEGEQSKENENYVSLMTIHQSKGLEFSNVYIIGMEENIFPSQQSMFSQKDIEEERRLLYVAITRAKKQIYMSYCQTRFRFNNYISNEPSRFINEIEQACIEKLQFSSDKNHLMKKRYTKEIRQPKVEFKSQKNKLIKLTKFNSQNKNINTLNLKIGKIIKHNIFGRGKIIDLMDSNQKMEIEFENQNRKTILVRYAKFDIID